MRADQTFLRSMGLRTAGRFGLAVVLAAASLAGCAKAPPASDPAAVADYRATNDPLEPTNRFFYDVSINDIDPYTLKPVAQAYVYVVPRPVRTGIHNMLVDYGQPVTFLNGILEGKPRRTGDSFVRFLLNTTVGVGGFFDVAKELGYRQNDSDGALTLAYYGLPSGPYLFLPLLGPSNPRAAAGQFGLDLALSPFTYVPRGYGLLTLNWAVYGMGIIDGRSLALHELDELQKTALDPYATIRSASRQQAAAQLKALRADNRSTPPDWYSH